ncbi:MAG: helix-turn-helix transcriptional regulator [Armatimonadetes bacterium]|nr:helix-turn-helix transcriptional regulator [Armatimonadota bacterium]
MAASRASADSLVATKGTAFGQRLRIAIKEEFGTNKEFARAMGVSEGRVSQILKGSEVLTSVTLDAVLASFSNLGRQERIHAAWIDTYAPGPMQGENLLDTESQETFLQSLPELIQAGRSREVLQRLLEVRSYVEDTQRWMHLSRATTELALRLERPSVAFGVAQELYGRATDLGELGWAATGLWTAAIALRNMPHLPAADTIQGHERAVEFLGQWSPPNPTLKRDATQALQRDRALTLIAVAEKRSIPLEQFSHEHKILQASLTRIEDPTALAIGTEVLARLSLAAENLFLAEEELESSQTFHPSAEHSIKGAILRAKIEHGRRDSPYRDTLTSALEEAWCTDDLHHVQVIERLLMKLELGRPL